MTEQKIRRVNNIIVLRDVEVDLEKVNQLFAPLPEKIPVRCKPGVCEFNFLNGVTVTAYNEHIDKEYQEELCNGCENVWYLIVQAMVTGGAEIWQSSHFKVLRDPGILLFRIRKYDNNGDVKIIPLGGIIVLPQWFAERLEKLTQEEQQKLLRWMLRHLEYVCDRMVVFANWLEFPANEYKEMRQLIDKVGCLGAIDLAYAQCDIEEETEYCWVDKKENQRGTVELYARKPFRRGDGCAFVLWSKEE
jgi:hypothetical protein